MVARRPRGAAGTDDLQSGLQPEGFLDGPFECPSRIRGSIDSDHNLRNEAIERSLREMTVGGRSSPDRGHGVRNAG